MLNTFAAVGEILESEQETKNDQEAKGFWDCTLSCTQALGLVNLIQRSLSETTSHFCK